MCERSLNGPESSWCHETSLREITRITVSLFRCPIFFNASKTLGNFGCFPAAHIQKSGPPAMRQSLARKNGRQSCFSIADRQKQEAPTALARFHPPACLSAHSFSGQRRFLYREKEKPAKRPAFVVHFQGLEPWAR